MNKVNKTIETKKHSGISAELMSSIQEMIFMSYDAMRPDEKDWKLFREKLPGCQENYMARMNKEYKGILAQDKNASDIFWELEERIRQDKKKTGVLARDIRRSNMWRHLLDLLNEGAITFNDLSEFSEELQEKLRWGMEY